MIERTNAMVWLRRWQDHRVIKVITGLRRAGKSTLLALFQDDLRKRGVSEDAIVTVNLESLDWYDVSSDMEVLKRLLPRLKGKRRCYLFLDEIQRVASFEKLVDALFTQKGIDIYLTGSNAHLLSSDLATYLSGRYVQYRLSPLSFAEYVSAMPPGLPLQSVYADYIVRGGLPYTVSLPEEEHRTDYLAGIFNTVILKDVVARYAVKDVGLLERVVRYIFNNIGNLTSIRNICQAIASDGIRISFQTVDNYLESLTNAYILNRVDRFDIKGKNLLKTGAKYYVEDLGLRRMLLGLRGGDLGHILENVVYMELRQRWPEVCVGVTPTEEIDFVVRNEKETRYYQVALTVRAEETLARELRPLRSLRDGYAKTLLTLDDDPDIDHNGIRQINALKWLLRMARKD